MGPLEPSQLFALRGVGDAKTLLSRLWQVVSKRQSTKFILNLAYNCEGVHFMRPSAIHTNVFKLQMCKACHLFGILLEEPQAQSLVKLHFTLVPDGF